MTPRTRLFAATLAGGALFFSLFLAAVAPVAATSSSDVSSSDPCTAARATWQAGQTVADGIALGDCMIADRLTYLSRASGRPPSVSALSDADRSALESILSRDTTGLTTLKGTLDGETTLSGVKSDLVAIVMDYRVYLLAARQVALVVGSDVVTAAGTKFATVNTKLEARIAAAIATGKDTTAASAALAAMNTAVTTATSDAAGLSAGLLALTPAEYNAGTAQPVLTAARTALGQARAQLISARADARAVLADLR